MIGRAFDKYVSKKTCDKEKDLTKWFLANVADSDISGIIMMIILVGAQD